MDTTYGVLCLIPPIVAIGLALWTKQTIFSLFIAVWLGSTMMNGFNPLVGFVKIISDYNDPLSQRKCIFDYFGYTLRRYDRHAP